MGGLVWLGLFLFELDGKLVVLMEEIADAKAFDQGVEKLKPVLDSFHWL